MVIKPGLDWPFDTQVPNSKNMIPLLERNESLVTWLQPCKGEIKDQFPVIKMGSRFYTLSLRQMKVRQPPLFIGCFAFTHRIHRRYGSTYA
jgi:hypothetical protein